mmetsp:Transcript_34203/g.80569  ORF Transcript_34203/g.80569 Transcript_34203/m.80569 type:complete len:104 (+) Transcript_34203:3045-3356(+)
MDAEVTVTDAVDTTTTVAASNPDITTPVLIVEAVAEAEVVVEAVEGAEAEVVAEAVEGADAATVEATNSVDTRSRSNERCCLRPRMCFSEQTYRVILNTILVA